MNKKRLLLFIVSYNAEKTITRVLERIPSALFEDNRLEVEILVIDDRSQDNTFKTTLDHALSFQSAPITVLQNPANLGYGGNQKVGYRYALENDFDYVALIHGDAQYAPEELPRLLEPLLQGESDALFGSRMMKPLHALKGGMPYYKFIGNRVLTYLQNLILGTSLSEFHSGYRLYSTEALARIPFERNSNYFDFDTDIIIQLTAAGLRIKELPIPTHYGDEICHVDGFRYAWRVILASLVYRLQALGLFYERKFDVVEANNQYQSKFHFHSSHSLAQEWVKEQENLLLLGCGPSELVTPFLKDGCKAYGADMEISPETEAVCEKTIKGSVEAPASLFESESFDRVLALDIIEHLPSPEEFLNQLRERFARDRTPILITTANIGFAPIRMMLLLGAFNYGKRGILDRTHTRLFTFGSLRHLLLQHGFEIKSSGGIPAPFPLAVGDNALGKLLLKLNTWAIAAHKGLFSYQIYFAVEPLPTTAALLDSAVQHSKQSVETQATAALP